MYGAILGDIIGSSYEFRPYKGKDFPLFTPVSRFTDDTVMTLAVAQGFLDVLEAEKASLSGSDRLGDLGPEQAKQERPVGKEGSSVQTLSTLAVPLQEALTRRMREFGLRHRDAGYGGGFSRWLQDPGAGPYYSYGNGSAMRVSGVAWLFDDLDQVIWAARLQAGLTHNHPEGLKGAEAVAACIFLARQQASKADIKRYVRETFAYNLDRSLDDIRPSYGFEVSCQHSVPEAILAFLEGQDFEDCIRNAISLGGDADTQAAIAGSIAEAYYGLPDRWCDKIKDFLPDDLLEVVHHYQKSVK